MTKHLTKGPKAGKTKAHKSIQKPSPKQGDPGGYLTPTQLRNARKRRAGKKDKLDPSLQYIANPKQAPTVQAAVKFFREKLCNFPVHLGPLQGWRTVAKLAVRADPELTIGLFVPNSHDLLPVPKCDAHHPSINQSIAQLQKLLRRRRVQAWNETTGRGNLRYIAINVERSTGKVQVTLVWKPDSRSDKTILDNLCHSIIDSREQLKLHSLWIHYNDLWKHANAIFDVQGIWEHRYGPKDIVEKLNIDDQVDVSLHFPPNVFRQANLDAFAAIVRKIREYLNKEKNGGHCVELYGGVGTIGLHVADICASIVSSDENPHNKECFDQSVVNMGTKKNITYKPLNATDMVHAQSLKGVDWIIVDPPRKGLDDSVAQAIGASSARILVYVSCGFDAFKRDFIVLAQKGWKLDQAEGHILFPGSDAIETLAFFRKDAPSL